MLPYLAGALWATLMLQLEPVNAFHRQHAVPIGEHSRRPYGSGPTEQLAPWDEDLHRLHARQTGGGGQDPCAFLASAATRTSGTSLLCVLHVVA